jgi:hypothetical protein
LFTSNLAVAAQEPTPASEPNLTEEQKEDFLRRGKVVASHQISGKAITQPWRVRLSDGSLTHDAVFQPVDGFKAVTEFEDSGGQK